MDAPREGRPTTRVNWLVRQLKTAPDAVRVEAFAAHARGSSAAELLGTVRENPAVLVADPAKEHPVLPGRDLEHDGHQARPRPGSFIDSVLARDRHLLRRRPSVLKAWSAAPPKLRQPAPQPPEVEPTKPPSLSSTEYSSQDGAQSDEAPGPDGGAQTVVAAARDFLGSSEDGTTA